MCRYQGCTVTQDSVLSGLLEQISAFEVQDNDVIVASFPKSGTTWLQQVVYMLFNPEDNSDEIMEWKFPYLEYVYPGLKEIENRKGQKRLIKTHLPYKLLPESAKNNKSKVIYIHRDAKDVIVSFYFFARMMTMLNYKGSLKDFAWQMMKDKVPYGPYFEHLDQYLSEADKRPEKVLAIKYEDMKQDPEKCIQEIAKFLQVF